MNFLHNSRHKRRESHGEGRGDISWRVLKVACFCLFHVSNSCLTFTFLHFFSTYLTTGSQHLGLHCRSSFVKYLLGFLYSSCLCTRKWTCLHPVGCCQQGRLDQKRETNTGFCQILLGQLQHWKSHLESLPKHTLSRQTQFWYWNKMKNKTIMITITAAGLFKYLSSPKQKSVEHQCTRRKPSNLVEVNCNSSRIELVGGLSALNPFGKDNVPAQMITDLLFRTRILKVKNRLTASNRCACFPFGKKFTFVCDTHESYILEMKNEAHGLTSWSSWEAEK